MSAFGLLPNFYPGTLTDAIGSFAFWSSIYFVAWLAGRYARTVYDARQGEI